MSKTEKTVRTLYLRDVTTDFGDLINVPSYASPFEQEMMAVFDFVAHVVDYAVMKYIDKEVPFLVKQEHLHAKLHHAGQKQHKQNGNMMKRWKWFVMAVDCLMLRCGPAIGVNITGHVEAATPSLFCMIDSHCQDQNFSSGLFLFHGFEELEHAALTIAALRAKTSVLWAIAIFPFFFLAMFVLVLMPPVVLILAKPSVLFRVRAPLELVRYYSLMVPIFLRTLYDSVTHWVCAIPESQSLWKARYESLEATVRARGIEWTVRGSEAYPVVVSR
eukprot:GDKH01007731.1.p1 GENE.GDKH01007731.1~~GDKH01007731.1.p1  ORF type:complete len:274 (-),score=48.97 GDKH01007731.1:164-985(-)